MKSNRDSFSVVLTGLQLLLNHSMGYTAFHPSLQSVVPSGHKNL